MKTEQDIEELLGLPILGLISPIPDSDLEAAKVEVRESEERRRK